MKHSILNNKQVKILAIAPYRGMKELISKEAKNYNNISLDAFVGDLEVGLDIALKNINSNYDAIISRGGTAKLIREKVNIPVINVPTSITDILQAIQLSDPFLGKKAVVGFPSITNDAKDLVSILKMNIEIFTISEASDISTILNQLKKDNYETIVCDVISSKEARKLGFNTILITSGKESIDKAINNALGEIKNHNKLRYDNIFFKNLLDTYPSELYVFKNDKSLYYSNIKEDNDKFKNILIDYIDDIITDGTKTITKALDGNLYSIKTYKIELDETYVAFFYTKSKANTINKNSGIDFYVKKEAINKLENSFFLLSNGINAIKEYTKKFYDFNQSMIIEAEKGSCSSEIVYDYFINCNRSDSTLIEIDFDILNDKSKEYLIDNQKSPIYLNDNVIHFKNIDHNLDHYNEILISTLINQNAYKHNTLIFSCEKKNINNKNINYLKNKLQCFILELASLKENIDHIPAIAKLYLNNLNAQGLSTVLTFENEALNVLCEYSWPENYNQLQRVLKQLCLTSNEHIIYAKDVTNILQSENNYEGTEITFRDSLNLNKPLKEIEKEIIRLCIKNNNGNQSKAAKQLKISRSTLWRLYKD